MEEKQIFATLEVSDHEVRMIVGEIFNTRFNILKVERVPVDALSYDTITDQDALTAAIAEAAREAGETLGAKIEKVILCVPALNTKRKPVRVSVPIEGIDGVITAQDIKTAVDSAQNVRVERDLALIQTVCVKYTIDGIASRRIPIGEHASQLTVDIDLICADRNMAYTLVGCTEQAGLQVMDIFLDVYAVAKEAALFEQSVDSNVLIMKMERRATTLGILSKGRLRDCVVVPFGVGDIAEPLVEQYGITRAAAVELVKYSLLLNEKVNPANLVHIWNDNGNARRLNEEELFTCVSPKVDEWVDGMVKYCGKILQAGKTTVIITGEGGEMQGLNEVLAKKAGTEVRNYIPETLGGRNAGMTACLGLFYAYKDKLPIAGYTDNSIDMDKFLQSVSYRSRLNKPEDTFTNRFKSLFAGSRK